LYALPVGLMIGKARRCFMKLLSLQRIAPGTRASKRNVDVKFRQRGKYWT